MRKRASYGAGRTFVQDGFDARTGDEREPGSNPGGRERKGIGGGFDIGRKRERSAE